MIKSFNNKKYGEGKDFWDNTWERTGLYSFTQIENDPLLYWFRKYFDKQGKILEGGCGPGYWVKYLSECGYDIVGVDNAPKIVEKINNELPQLDISLGSVFDLDFPDNYFSGYYSGGVVEHFETGPDKIIDEAFRVLKPEGYLLLTVPYLNLMRRFDMMIPSLTSSKLSGPSLKMDGKDTIWRMVSSYGSEDADNDDYIFHEYIMTRKEICKRIKAAGFNIVEVSPFSIKYGMRDYISFINFQNKCIAKEKSNDNSSEIVSSVERSSKLRLLWRNLTTYERSDGPLSSATIWFMRRLFSNMIMVVCQKPKSTLS